ncbi:MAG: hypothetical protein IPN82_15555 [Chitinophagaceae bacterium]|nr:hypothetical protein [Chitinophagaceae bacterium]MBP6478506.1 hypothetical protein [Chitinophagaceae bacterium]MBP7107309.1 hypothetical protein [Chitinophagaceae bacterium]MBP7315960.1 hypothetical protein [Chitinophagaceae bacterium]HQV54316.1 hypothetical protein [Chitinophagaceae bacterium]
MKKNILLTSICFAIFVTASAQWPSNVTVIDTNNDSIIVQGDLAKGSKMADLSWAWNSANACFPGTQSSKFKGNHVFYALTMPTQCEMKISVTPADDNADLSIYAYRLGATEYNLVPNLGSCITCEADHKWDGNWKGKVQTSERKVSMQNPGKEFYNILIGVSAPAATSGSFNLKVKFEK